MFTKLTFELLVSSLVQASDQPPNLLHHVYLLEAVRAELVEAINVTYMAWANCHVLYKFAQDGL